ncbi:MAG: polymer-forming cytoskeletal protein [Candidatus Latescibacterota bacterium]|jgi:hypothetical protein
MPEGRDIHRSAEAILAAGPLARSTAEGLAAGPLNGLHEGDTKPGMVLSGEGSLVVRGSLLGAAGTPCEVAVEGDLVVTGSVRHARIACRRLLVAGDLTDAEVEAGEGAMVAGDLAHGRVTVGSFRSQQRRLAAARLRLQHCRQELALLTETIPRAERALIRARRALGAPPLRLSVRALLLDDGERVTVDLRSFHRSRESEPPAQSRAAFDEFFAKGIIGILARVNRAAITVDREHERGFVVLLRELRHLVTQVFDQEQATAGSRSAQEEIDALIAQVRGRHPSVQVAGTLSPETQIEMLEPVVLRLEDQEVRFTDDSATLRIGRGSRSDHLRLAGTDVDGGSSSEEVPSSGLRCVRLELSHGRIVHAPDPEPPEPGYPACGS